MKSLSTILSQVQGLNSIERRIIIQSLVNHEQAQRNAISYHDEAMKQIKAALARPEKVAF